MSHNWSLKIMKSLLLNLTNGRFSNNTKNMPQSSKKVDFHITRFSLTKLFQQLLHSELKHYETSSVNPHSFEGFSRNIIKPPWCICAHWQLFQRKYQGHQGALWFGRSQHDKQTKQNKKIKQTIFLNR